MKIDNLIAGMKANGIKPNRKFDKACKNDGCISAYQDLYDDILKTLGDTLYYGVNNKNGFKQTKDAMVELTDLLVDISEQAAETKYKEFSMSFKKLKAKLDIELDSLNKGENDMKNEVLKRIEAYKNGTQVLLGVDMAEERKPILEQAIKKLDALATELNNVIDGTSADALQHAKKVVNSLQTYADTVAKLHHGQSTLRLLDDAMTDLKKWSSIEKVKTSIFSRVNTDEIRFEDTDTVKQDQLTLVANSRDYIEKTNNFLSNVADYKKLITRKFSNETNNEKLKALDERLREIDAEKINLRNMYNNGEISRERVGEEATYLKEEEENIKEDRLVIKDKIDANRNALRTYDYTFDTLNSLLDTIDEYRMTGDLSMITSIGKYIDFDALYKLMHGESDPQDEISVRVLKQIEKKIEEFKLSKLSAFKDTMRTEDAQRRQKEREERESHRAINDADKTARQAKNDAAADWLLGPEKTEEAKEEKTPEQLNDDIFNL